jgi:hypothetical protein
MGAKRKFLRNRRKHLKYIKVPNPVKLKDLVTREEVGVEYTFFRWLQEIVLMDIRFAVDWKTNRSAVRISDAFFNKGAGASVAVEEADFDLLKASSEEPQRRDRATGQMVKGYEQPALFQQVIPFVEAVQAASDRVPE